MNKFYKYLIGMLFAFALMFSFGFSTHAQKPDVDFIDVSHHNMQNGLPLSFFQTIKSSAGVNSVVIKVSEGDYYLDNAASVNIANAKQSGMIVHAYHFARFTSIDSAKKEAQWFDKKLQIVSFDKKNDGYVVLDIESANLSKYPFDLTMYTNAFIDEMKSLGYTKVDLYTGSYYYNNRLIPSMLHVDSPWLAAYPSNPIKDHPTPIFSNGKGAWQWSSDYRFNGMNNFGRFDVSEDYANKYTQQVTNSTVTVNKIKFISLINYMKSKNMDSSYANRAKLAKAYGIENYKGTAAQNLALLSKLKSGVKPAKVDTSKLTTKTPPPVKQAKPVDNEIKVDPKVLPKVQPKAQYKTTTKTVIKIYYVKSGDSLWSIAKSKNTTVSKLVTLNNIKRPNELKIGQKIKYPVTVKVTVNVTSPTPSKKVYYTVKRGDVVSKIASKYHVSISSIKSLNKLNKYYTIYVGENLRIK